MGFDKSPIYLPQADLSLHAPLHRHHRPLSSPPTPRDPSPVLHAPERGPHAPACVSHASGNSFPLQPPPLECPPVWPFLHLHHRHGWLFGFLLCFRLLFLFFCVFMFLSVVFCCFYFPVALFGFCGF